jgi:hypothetical protein
VSYLSLFIQFSAQVLIHGKHSENADRDEFKLKKKKAKIFKSLFDSAIPDHKASVSSSAH